MEIVSEAFMFGLFSAGILDWTTNKLVNMDRRIGKILPLHGCLHVARPYLTWVEGQRGLIGFEECVKRQNKSLCGYLRKNAANSFKDKVLVEEEYLQDYQRRRKEKKVTNWKEKPLHGEFVEQTSAVTGEEPWG